MRRWLSLGWAPGGAEQDGLGCTGVVEVHRVAFGRPLVRDRLFWEGGKSVGREEITRLSRSRGDSVADWPREFAKFP